MWLFYVHWMTIIDLLTTHQWHVVILRFQNCPDFSINWIYCFHINFHARRCRWRRRRSRCHSTNWRIHRQCTPLHRLLPAKARVIFHRLAAIGAMLKSLHSNWASPIRTIWKMTGSRWIARNWRTWLKVSAPPSSDVCSFNDTPFILEFLRPYYFHLQFVFQYFFFYCAFAVDSCTEGMNRAAYFFETVGMTF